MWIVIHAPRLFQDYKMVADLWGGGKIGRQAIADHTQKLDKMSADCSKQEINSLRILFLNLWLSSWLPGR